MYTAVNAALAQGQLLLRHRYYHNKHIIYMFILFKQLYRIHIELYQCINRVWFKINCAIFTT